MLWTGIVIGSVCLFVCALVCVFLCPHKVSKTTDQKLMLLGRNTQIYWSEIAATWQNICYEFIAFDILTFIFDLETYFHI